MAKINRYIPGSIIHINDLIPWFTEDQRKLPAAYVASCQRFFLELDRRQADKQQATSPKLQAPSLTGTKL